MTARRSGFRALPDLAPQTASSARPSDRPDLAPRPARGEALARRGERFLVEARRHASLGRKPFCVLLAAGADGSHDRAICGSRERRAFWEGALRFLDCVSSAAFSLPIERRRPVPEGLEGNDAFQKTVSPLQGGACAATAHSEGARHQGFGAPVRCFGGPLPAQGPPDAFSSSE